MPTKLLDYINRVPQERIFLALESKIYTFGAIADLYREIKAKYPQLEKANCAVLSKDRESLALYLPVLDGISTSLFLQATDIEESVAASFYKAANIHFIVELSKGHIISINQPTHKECAYSPNPETFGDYLLATSGTTGTPKLASYSLGTLLSTAQKDVEKGSQFIWGLCYDINRFAGLQVYLQAIASGSRLVVGASQDTVEQLVTQFTENKVNCLSATPSFWRQLLMIPAHTKIPLKRITLGGEISTQMVLDALARSYHGAKVTHIYASTEAGVGFAVKGGREGFPVDYLESSALSGCQLRVKDGHLWVRSERGCNNFVTGQLEIDNDGFLNTGDLVSIKDQRVYFLGRSSGSINVGGNKVMPEKIECILEGCEYVSMARVFSKNNPVLGSLVSAELVLTFSGQSLTPKELKTTIIQFCRDKLKPYEIPVLIKAVDNIKTNATGKKVRK